MHLAFFLVNLLVLLTVVISDVNLSVSQLGWLLGFVTGLSYLILPWFFYWFITNYENFLVDAKKLVMSRFQLFGLVAVIIIGFAPVAIPSLISVTQTETYSIPNWVYAWQLEVAQFIFWLLFAVLGVNNQYNLTTLKLDEYNKKFTNRIIISAILVFSTPVFFVISSGFILLSLVIYIIAYYVVYVGLKKYYSADTVNQTTL